MTHHARTEHPTALTILIPNNFTWIDRWRRRAKRWPRQVWRIILFIVVLRANKIHSKLLSSLCLFHFANWAGKWREWTPSNASVRCFWHYSAVRSYENVAKVSRKNICAGEMVRYIRVVWTNDKVRWKHRQLHTKVWQRFYEYHKLFVNCREEY